MKCQNSKLSERPRIQPPIRRRRGPQRANRHIRTVGLWINRARRGRRLLDQDIPPERRRPVLCDGESLAFNEVSRTYDAARIEAGVRWFVAAGHRRTVAVVPGDLRAKVSNGYALDNLQNEGRLVVVENSSGGSADVNGALEKELLERAVAEQAAVISEREFRQVYNNYPGVRPVVDNRVVGFCFFKGEIFIPVDPYGRYGPILEHILSL